MDGIQLKILNDEADINFGAVYENAVAQELVAHGFTPTYYSSRAHGEVDFILEQDAKVLPVEVKSGKHYKRHRALTHLLGDAEYDFPQAIVFDDDRLEVEGRIRYMPIYMAMFLQKDALPEKMIFDIGAPVT